MTLFDDGLASSRSSAPLAVRMRPRSLDEVTGQDRALAPGSPLRTLLTAPGESPVVSVILWGPPGTGKTTIAMLLSAGSGRAFVELSAVTAGVKDVRAVIERARDSLSMQGRGTVLFIDEVHRFSKSQQDALLPAVENGWVTLIAATTENPNFSVIAPLLSRSVVVALSPLTDGHVEDLLLRAIDDPRGLAGSVVVDDDALAHLVRTANGDARRALTGLDAAATSSLSTIVESSPADPISAVPITVSLADAERAVQQAAVIYDKDGDQHYDVISAFIKSIRGSDPDAALHYLARMLEAGEDPRFVARRLMIAASEDIGMAEPSVLQTAVAAAQAVAMVGMPEAAIILAHATIHAALAPKSNAVVVGLGAATADVRAGGIGRVPAHLRDGHYPGAAALGHGRGYVYPHDVPGGVAAQQYLPDELVARSYYRPSTHGAEAAWGEIAARLRELRSEPDR
jgi:putative ATPase